MEDERGRLLRTSRILKVPSTNTRFPALFLYLSNKLNTLELIAIDSLRLINTEHTCFKFSTSIIIPIYYAAFGANLASLPLILLAPM